MSIAGKDDLSGAEARTYHCGQCGQGHVCSGRLAAEIALAIYICPAAEEPICRTATGTKRRITR